MDMFSMLKSGTTFKKQPKKEEEPKSHVAKVTVRGKDVPPPLTDFAEIEFTQLQEMQPTLIQKHGIPALVQRRDFIGIAPTGSGKTLAYLVPIINLQLNSLIIIPTRELEQQIKREIAKYNKECHILNLESGDIQQLNKNLSSGRQCVLIATPTKILNMVGKNLKLNVDMLVLDECDKLLDLGFIEQVDEILAALPNGVQKALFSATVPSSIEMMAHSFMNNHIKVTCGAVNTSVQVKQELVFVGQEEGKLIAVRNLLRKGIRPPILIFVQSIERAKELFHELVYDNISVDVIHSDRNKAARDNIITNFRIGKIFVLIATELMARGIDFKGVGCVINYDFPTSVQSYVHRIGRTGRAGRSGLAYTFFTKADAPYLKTVVNVMKSSGCDVPDWMMELKGPTKEMKQALKKTAMERDSIKTVSKYDIKRQKKKMAMIEGSKKRKIDNGK